MKTFLSHIRGRLMCRLAGLFFCIVARQLYAAPFAPGVNITGASQDFSAVTRAVVELLQSRDTARFAKTLAPTFEDWQSIYSTNAVTRDPNALKDFRSSVKDQRQEVEQSAKQLLAKADELHLDFSKGILHPDAVPPKYLGSTHYPTLQAENDVLPYAAEVEISFKLDAGASNAAGGDFKLVVRGLLKFPGGWRSLNGVGWTSFPSTVADAGTRRNLAIMEKAAAYEGITDKDDPALLKLAGALVHFVRTGDVNVYQREALATADMIWTELRKQTEQRPSRHETDQMWKEEQLELMGAARATAGLMIDAGIDLKNATIVVDQASIRQLDARGQWGGLSGNGFQVKLTVTSEGKSKTGQSASGTYILAVDEIGQFGDDWKVTGKVRWDKLPTGVVDEKTAAALKLESYVAENRTLPPGTAAPEIEFTRLDNQQKMKLSDLRGKVVVLDFWATWCGPCQEPLAELQTIRQEHPRWQDRVAVVPLSIDDTIKIVRKHLDKRSWTNTFNVWAGDGGWSSAPAKSFRVSAVPTTYVIDQQGKIIYAGHPMGMQIGVEVNTLLKRAGQ